MSPGAPGARRTRAAFLVASILSCVACTSLRVPTQPPSFKAEQFSRMERLGVTLEARPLRGTDEYWDLFDENLPEFGVVGLWIAVRNGQGSPLNLAKSKWILRTGAREYRAIDADEVVKRYYRRRGIRAVTVHADRRARSGLETLMLGPGRIPVSGMREGFVFFRVEPSPQADWMKGSSLIVRKIRNAEGQSIDFDLPLAYATP
jgi:hypothetical protein